MLIVWGSFNTGRKILKQAKYGHLMLPGAFPDKLAPGIGFIYEVHCAVPVVKNFCDSQVITNKF